MVAWAYTLAYNEELLIKYWVRHYRTFCDRVIVYVDKESTDNTATVARGAGAEVRDYYGSGDLDDQTFIRFAQDHYREARQLADWVVWTDADEIVYHPTMIERLAKLQAAGINLPLTVGIGMIGNAPPTTSGQIYHEIQYGIPAPDYSKVAIFSPYIDVEWAPGKHTARVGGPQPVVSDDGTDRFKLLHFRWLGEKWFIERNNRNFKRQSEQNLRSMHGKETHPEYAGTYSLEWYKKRKHLAEKCVAEQTPHRLFGRWL